MSDSHSPDGSPQLPSSSVFLTATALEDSSILPIGDTASTSLPSNIAHTASHQPSIIGPLDPLWEQDVPVFDENDNIIEILNPTPKPKKRRLSRHQQATRKAIKTINDIWKLCSIDANGAEDGQGHREQTQSEDKNRVGLAAIPEQKQRRSSPSYPVYRLRTGLYLVAATRADYREFKRLQGRTSARKTITSFKKSALLPGHCRPFSYIKVDMPGVAHDYLATLIDNFKFALTEQLWEYNGARVRYLSTGGGAKLNAAEVKLRWQDKVKSRCPDASLTSPELGSHRPPFLVMEVAVTKDARDQVHDWVAGGRGYIKLVVVVQLSNAPIPERYRVNLSIIKPIAVPAGKPDRPRAYRMKAKYLIDKLEIYPQQTQRIFEISFADLLSPKDGIDPSKNTSVARVDLGLPFWVIAEGAVKFKLEQDEKRTPTPPDPDQEVSSSSSSGSSYIGEEPLEWVDPDDEIADPTYKGKNK
ncbi:MAG: hypothetical protein Q9214_000238 [Letrouitia sp. 1 TL-2023]